MSRRSLVASGFGGAGVFAGFGLWAWFLAGKSLDVADQWSSVLSSFAALAGLVIAVVALVAARKGPQPPVPERGVRIGGDAPQSVIITGDGNSVQR